jgi:hypothetical protein
MEALKAKLISRYEATLHDLRNQLARQAHFNMMLMKHLGLAPQSNESEEMPAAEAAEDDDVSTTINEDPFYITNEDVLSEQVKRWSTFLPSVKPFYAVKCNPNARLLDLMKRSIILDLNVHL